MSIADYFMSSQDDDEEGDYNNPIEKEANPAKTHPNPFKKPRLSERMDRPCAIFTFRLSHCPLKVQLLSKHTLYDLVDLVCKVSAVGDDGSGTVNEHLWNINVPRKGKYLSRRWSPFRSGGRATTTDLEASGPPAKEAILGNLELKEGDEMELMYDYNIELFYQLTVVSIEDKEVITASDGRFPRIHKVDFPSGYRKFTTSEIDLNLKFPTLNQLLFEGCDRNVDVCLFKAGQKPNNFGYLELDEQFRHMIFMPVPPERDLSDYLHCLNVAAKPRPNGHYTWFSVTVIPRYKIKQSHSDVYGKYLRRGHIELQLVDRPAERGFNRFFPNVAALAGFRKDSKIKRGWITYKDEYLRICSGSARTVKCLHGKGLAFYGAGQHHPDSPADVVMEFTIRLESLHDLFCTVEGLLGTL